jgi:hypothetical protein
MHFGTLQLALSKRLFTAAAAEALCYNTSYNTVLLGARGAWVFVRSDSSTCGGRVVPTIGSGTIVRLHQVGIWGGCGGLW